MQVFDINDFQKAFQVNFNQILGKGYSANVFQVIEINSKHAYALKCQANLNSSIQVHSCIIMFILATKNEIEVLSLLSHPNIIKSYGYSKDYSCLLLEYLPNGSFYQILQKGPMSLTISNQIFIQLLDTVHYIHSQGYSHGDLKPENILISEDFQLKICDFGFTHQLNQQEYNLVGGSEGYNAPEIYACKNVNLEKCDIFSLGVIYFIMVTGHPPFQSNNPGMKDPWWNLIEKQNWEKFWKILNKTNLEMEFKNIIQQILSLNSLNRPSIQDLLNNKWIQENSKADKLQIRKAISERVSKQQ